MCQYKYTIFLLPSHILVGNLRPNEERSSGSLRWEFFGEKIPARLCQICVTTHR
ncbi:MAG: hypothetical protein P1P64_01545 [Treponemataceae bacterium]